ncbi:MAG TPA: CocE/NonD family hydrolase, partial [Thermoanaerobaculia bacterium]|nr:CocE/NonD family hydrolase [Thermoanaerobaculia bacterium]
LPVVFTLTPYAADTYHDRAQYFARHGYVYALVDVRGRGNSEGEFEPFLNEGRDGHDVVEWLARQPWSDGKVTMWGGSYAGHNQWMTLREKPPHLATIVPVASPYPGLDFPFQKNIFSAYDIQWLTYTSGLLANRGLFNDSPFWIQKFGELYRAHRPFRELDEVTGNRSTVFQKWIAHPTPDEYWKSMVPARADYGRMDVPILSITGYYDGDQPGALKFYREHIANAGAAARARHYLILGPWDHAGTRTPTAEVGGLTLGPASLLDMNDLHRQWYDWTMKGGAKPEFLKKRVAYYVVGPGAETWKYADDLESVATERRTLYLASDGGRANDVFRSGRLTTEAPRSSAPDLWVYDPLDARPAEREISPISNDNTTQTLVFDLNGRGVIYHSEPFAEPTEISGHARLTLHMAIDVPDTDFEANLYEILPDGSSVLLAVDRIRARYRNSLEKAELVPVGQVQRYIFNDFTWFSRRVSKGSRLRLVVLSPNSIYLEKNYNGGGVVAAESGKDARTARITLYHDAERPSALEIPIVR